MSKYTVGRIITGTHGYGMTYPRPLLRDGEQIAIVDSNEGPALLGEMDAREAAERFPEAFDDWCPLCGNHHADGDGTPGYSCA